MDDLLLQAKLAPPISRIDPLPRPQLYRRLERGIRGKLTLIGAPAGSGKTTLVAGWLRHREAKLPDHAWLTLDRRDRDPEHFLRYLLAALDQADSRAVQPGRELHASGAAAHEAVLDLLLNQLARREAPLLLVLDDYQMAEGADANRLLEQMVTYLPPTVRLLLLSRTDPDLPLHRLRAAGELTRLGLGDLRLGAAEARQMITRLLERPLPAPQIDTLVEQTDGWAAGVQLAALAAGDQRRAEAFPGRANVVAYLLHEVVERQPQELQRFLTECAFLPHLHPDLCNSVRARIDSAAYLLEIERRNLFLTRLAGPEPWYQLHPLLRDALGHRLVDPQARRRAARWFDSHNRVDDALDQWLALGDTAAGAELLERHVEPVILRGDLPALRRWLARLPETALGEHALLAIGRTVVALFEGRHLAAQRCLDMARDAAGENRALRARCAATASTVLATLHDGAGTLREATAALDLLEPVADQWRCMVFWNMAFAYRLHGRYKAAADAYRQAIATARSAGNDLIQAQALSGLGYLALHLGNLPEALRLFAKVWELVSRSKTVTEYAALDTLIGAAQAHLARQEPAPAAPLLERAVALSEALRNDDLRAAALRTRALLRHATGDAAGARADMDEALLLVQTRTLPRQAPLVFVAAARLALLEGDPVAAARLAAAHDLPLTRARLALGAGHPEETVALLDGLTSAAGEPVKYETRLRAALLRAAAMDALGKREEAEQVLARAVREAEPAGFLRPFLDHGTLLLPLLRRIATRGPESRFTRHLIRLLDPRGTSPVEALSPRETEVLQLVAAGHTNQQIADALIISLATAKKHVSNILGKLHVDNRTEAVARARELGLLGD